MTREEAIRILNRLSPAYKGAENDSAYLIGEALTMGVKALEQEPMFIAKSDGTIEQIKSREKGRWIPYLKEGLIVKCSECKSRYTLGYNFCPNCGADMREVEDRNDCYLLLRY